MDDMNQILRGLERIESKLADALKLSERVSKLEAWQSWLMGAWAALTAACAFLGKATFGK